MSGLTSEILIRLRPLLRAGSLSATGSSRYGQIHNPSFVLLFSFENDIALYVVIHEIRSTRLGHLQFKIIFM